MHILNISNKKWLGLRDSNTLLKRRVGHCDRSQEPLIVIVRFVLKKRRYYILYYLVIKPVAKMWIRRSEPKDKIFIYENHDMALLS